MSSRVGPLSHVGKVLGRILVLVWVVTTATFFLVRLAPGDPAMNIVGEMAPPEQLAAVRSQFGLDQPIVVQYGKYLWNALHGDLGTSFVWQESAVQVVLRQLPYTVLLAVVSILVVGILATMLGAIAGWVGGKFETAVSTVVVTTQSLPDFWVAVMLVLTFSVTLQWLPSGGLTDPTSLILPVATVVIYQLGTLTRIALAETRKIKNFGFIVAMTSRALPAKVIARHVVRNISLPMLTLLGVRLAGMLNGIIIVEAVFSWPGVGGTAVQALRARDYPLLQATIILSTVLVVSLSSIVDALYSRVDPRVREAVGRG